MSRRPRPFPAHSRALALAILAAGLLLSPIPAGATLVQPLSDTELIAASPLIVTGRCIDAHSRWIGRRLVTVATVEVADTWKSDVTASGARYARPDRLVRVVLPGGIDVDRAVPLAVVYPGAPTLLVGEQAVLFLQPAEGFEEVPDGFVVTGFSQGKLAISENASGDRWVSRGGRRSSLTDWAAAVRREGAR